MAPETDDSRLRARLAAEAFQLRSKRLREVQNDVAALKAELRALANHVAPRLQALEGRLVVLSRTVGHLLAELDQTHATTVVAIRRGDTPTVGAPILPTEQVVDPHAPTPRPENPEDPGVDSVAFGP